MHWVRNISVIAALLSGASVNVLAIATTDNTISTGSPTNQGYSLNWDYIYKYKNASSVAVDHYWILTAAHVADDGPSGNLSIDGEIYTQQEIVFHSTADLALVRYDKPLPGYYPLHEGEIHNGKNGAQRVWDSLVMVGYGYTGEVTALTFSQSGTAGTKRWGTNKGTAETSISIDVGGTAGNRTTQCFQTLFSLIDTPYEGGGNVYDSGGPYFIERDSTWKLAGINLYRDGLDPYTGNRAALISSYVAWIKSVITDYDTDMDGLPDWYETLYAGDGTSMVATNDLDGDQFTNYEEWIADTVPDDGNSYLRISAYTNASEIVFAGSTNRQYRIDYRTQLADTNEVWQTEIDWFTPVSTQSVESVSTSTSKRFYRVGARL